MSGNHWLVVAVMAPIAGAVLAPIVGRRGPRLVGLWSIAVTGVASVASAFLIFRVAREGVFSYHFGGWAPPFGIEFRFDEFGAAVGVICLLGFLVMVYSIRYVEKLVPERRIPYYYSLLLLNLGGMIGLAVTGDLFNLFVFLEILSISGYGLVAIGGERVAEVAAIKYLLMGAISSLLILFATGLIYALTGTLNMVDMGARLSEGVEALPAALAVACLTVGFSVKAALFPIHVWLPDAHSIAPSPVSAILSGLVVKVGVLGMLRMYLIFNHARLLDLAPLNTLLTWLGAISIVLGAFFAMTQEDIKMMLAYSTISNIGYIFMGLGLASELSIIGAGVHIFNHALIKATLFLGAGCIIYKTGYRNLSDLRGVGRAMPITSGAITIGAVSIVGIPPTAGFLCKWYIALGAIQAGKILFAITLLFGALFIFVYYIRMLNCFYFQEPLHGSILEVGEAPASMLVPVLILAVLCLVMGVFGRLPLTFIQPAAQELLLLGS